MSHHRAAKAVQLKKKLIAQRARAYRHRMSTTVVTGSWRKRHLCSATWLGYRLQVPFLSTARWSWWWMLVAGEASSVTGTLEYCAICEQSLHKDKTAWDSSRSSKGLAHVVKVHALNCFHSDPSEKCGLSSTDFHETHSRPKMVPVGLFNPLAPEFTFKF